jgi:hypothetical protein
MTTNNPRKPKTQNNSALNQAAKLQSMEKRLKKLTTRLWAVMFLLFIILAAGALLYINLYYKQLALALSSNYTKTSGDMLTAQEWNNLSSDFVAKSGDTMSGNLTVDGGLTINGDVDAPNLTRDSCYWTGWYDNVTKGVCGSNACAVDSTCPEGYFLAGIGFENSPFTNTALDNWRLYCCEL